MNVTADKPKQIKKNGQRRQFKCTLDVIACNLAMIILIECLHKNRVCSDWPISGLRTFHAHQKQITIFIHDFYSGIYGFRFSFTDSLQIRIARPASYMEFSIGNL